MIAMISAALASGALVGFSLGLVGGGGSILATPLLLYVVGVAQPHIAIGTGALAVSVNAFANLAGHARAGNVRWRSAVIFSVVGTLGAFAGSSLGKLVDGNRLLFLFGLIMIAVGAMMLRPRRENAAAEREANLATSLLTAAVAFLAGMASGFFGIGGGFLIVPALMLATGMSIMNAVSSSLVAVTAFGLTTAASYAWSGLISWGLAGLFVAGGIAGGLIGTRSARLLSAQRGALNIVFAAVIIAVALYMLARNLSLS